MHQHQSIPFTQASRAGGTHDPAERRRADVAVEEVVAKLRRLADALESGKPFRIQIAGERIHVPARAQFSVEHERSADSEEVEFQMRWSIDAAEPVSEDEAVV